MRRYLNDMPSLNLLLRNGSRMPITLKAGVTLASALKAHHALHFAARNGVERQVGMAWEKVSLSYMVKADDVLRVANPFQVASGSALGSLLLRIVKSLVPRKKREGSRNRKR